MAFSISYLWALAAKALLEGAHIPLSSSPTATSVTPASSTPPVSSPSTSSLGGAGGSYPRHFRLQVLSSSGNTVLNNQPVTAGADSLFTIGGPVAQTCDPSGTSTCSSYDHSTTFTIANGYANLFTGNPALQQTVFIDPSKKDTLSFAAVLTSGSVSPPPATALRTGIVVRAANNGAYNVVYNDGQDRSWIACVALSTSAAEAPFVVVADISSRCDGAQDITIQAVPVNDPGAWAYGP